MTNEDYWADHHVNQCDYCFHGGDPEKCIKWQHELDMADVRADMMMDLEKERVWEQSSSCS